MNDSLLPLDIPAEILEDIYREARAAYPTECCGWLSGAKGGTVAGSIRRCVNDQSANAYAIVADRTAETAYNLSGADLLELNRSLDSETPALVIYHSHPNGRAYFSPTDIAVATSPWGGEPAYPVQQLVVGIDSRRVVEAALFAWSDEEEGFVEISRFEGADI